MGDINLQVLLMAVIGILGGKQFWDYLQKRQAIKAEKEKAMIDVEMDRKEAHRKLSTEERNEVKEMLNAQLQEAKDELKEAKEELKKATDEIGQLKIEMARLEGNYNNVRQRLLGYAQHSRGKKGPIIEDGE
jgi:uncharacterized membrane protein